MRIHTVQLTKKKWTELKKYEMIQYELMEEAFMKLESSLRVSINADYLEKQYGWFWDDPVCYLVKTVLRYDFYFKSFLRSIKLSPVGTIDVCTSQFIVNDIFPKPESQKDGIGSSYKIATRLNPIQRIHGKRWCLHFLPWDFGNLTQISTKKAIRGCHSTIKIVKARWRLKNLPVLFYERQDSLRLKLWVNEGDSL